MNSTIKPKKGPCIDCVAKGDSSEKYLTAGRCQSHYRSHRSKVCEQRNKSREGGKVIPMFKTSGLAETLQASIDVIQWFKERVEIVSKHPYCMECGTKIPPQFYRHAVAHIFPKSPNSGFPSVATAKWNYLILGAGCGCHDKTHTISTFCKMKVWSEAVSRYNTFKDQITETHKYKTLFENAIHSRL